MTAHSRKVASPPWRLILSGVPQHQGQEDFVARLGHVIVDNRQHRRTGAAQDGTTGGIAKGENHGFVALYQGIIHDGDGEGLLSRVPIGKGDGPRSGGVIRAGGGSAIAGA